MRSIVVLRPNALGDFLFALPALRALRHTWPGAHIAYLGRRWHAEFLAGRDVVDEAIEMPRVRHITAEEEDETEVEAFCERLRARRFDLALQLFGGGRFSNPFVRRLGARLTVGLRAPNAAPLDRTIPYIALQNERLRLLETAALAGARIAELAPALPLLERDRVELERVLPLPAAPVAVLQPGASDPRRRWPPERFAAVGDRLAAAGAVVVVQGSRDETPLTRAVVRTMKARAIDAGARLSLGGLAALLARAELVVANDTGPLHLAQAVGTPTVGIYWFTNLLVSAPLAAAPHRQALALRTRCPQCGAENLRSRCEHDPCFVEEVSIEEVMTSALELWRERARARDPRQRRRALRPDPRPGDAGAGRAAPSAPSRSP